MAEQFQFGLNGIGSNVKVGKGGPRVKANAGVVELRNALDNGFAVVLAADPIGLDDVVTKRYLETRANVIVTGQIDGNAPAAVVNGAVYIATTTGGTFTAGRLYFGENATWNEITPVEGLTVSITDSLTGGTLTFQGDHRYLWDADGAVWVDLGPAPAETRNVKTHRASLAFGSAGTVNIGSVLPTGAIVNKILVNVTQAFNGTASTVSFGVSGAVAELGSAAESDLATVGLYAIECYKQYNSNEQLIATYVADGATAGAASVEVFYSLV
jgi:hypothetical protein